MDMFFDILIMACGVYMIYWAVQMRRENKIPEMLVGKGFKIERAKDPAGFIKFTFPYTFGLGIILFAVGLYLSISGIATSHPFISSFISLVMVVLVMGYGIILMKAQKKYLVGLDKNGKKLD